MLTDLTDLTIYEKLDCAGFAKGSAWNIYNNGYEEALRKF